MVAAVERYEGHVKLWWTSADGQACEEIESFPDGATFDELMQAENAFWAEAADMEDRGYDDGTVTAELDGEQIAEF